MSDYVKSTNFTSKDSLAVGNPLKIVKGTEIDIEFNNIATAISTKADTNSPSFTGTPVAPTASVGTSNTQLATTAFVVAALAAVYPVGSVYTNAGVATNPATLLGFGTWEAFGSGRVLVGVNAGDASFDTLGETGGSKDAIVVSHTHTIGNAGSHSHTYSLPVHRGADAGYTNAAWGGGDRQDAASVTATSSTVADHTHSISTTGSSGTNANLQPYITVHMWKRVS